jgi:hypothetical protein
MAQQRIGMTLCTPPPRSGHFNRTEELSHKTGKRTTASHSRQANKPSTATNRCLFQDNTLTKNTAVIKTTQMGEIPSRPDDP